MKPITENIIEQSAIEILQSQGWEYANLSACNAQADGKEISPVRNMNVSVIPILEMAGHNKLSSNYEQ
jgi:hypothetical protein